MTQIYTVKKGDSPWKYAEYLVKQEKESYTQKDVANKLKELPSLYSCSDINEFGKKYFSCPNSIIEIKGTKASSTATTEKLSSDSVPIPKDSIVCKSDATSIYNRRQDSTVIRQDSTVADTFQVSPKKYVSWETTQAQYDRINNLTSEKQKVIEYNKRFGNLKSNYVIIDKENYTAEVYTPDGKLVKSYEIGVARNKSDALLRRNKKNHTNDFAATPAGIYTATYRGNGRDSYKRLYNDRILILSNDAAKDKKLGNGSGETGAVLHQVPNGNKERIKKLKAEGTSESNNRFSDGCVNFLPEDFDDCMTNIAGVDTKVFILPEDKNNFFKIKNGKLHLTQKNYTGDVATGYTKKDPVKSISIKAPNGQRDEAREMSNTLSIQKMSLIKDLGIDNDTYNMLALLTLGIAGQETKYGDPTAGASKGKPYYLKENAPWLTSFVKKVVGNNSYDSRGITQMKLKSYTDKDVQALLKKYSINENNLSDPNKCAIATMIVLTSIYKNELPALKTQMEKNNISKQDALCYCWSNHKNEIINGTATPEKNGYVKGVKKYMNQFDLAQEV